VHSPRRRLEPLTLDNLGDLLQPCRACVSWELGSVAAERAAQAGDQELEKEAWVSAVLLEWGTCGALAYIDDIPAGYVLYAPAALVPRASTFPTSPVSADAALLVTAYVSPDRQRAGLGRSLVHAAAKDMLQRGFRALEAFGDARWERPGCVVPADYLTAVGFETVRPHHRWPRLRLDLRSTFDWHVDVAVERILGTVIREPALRPV
jgi:GNAT superfamily N-acetyltransferase